MHLGLVPLFSFGKLFPPLDLLRRFFCLVNKCSVFLRWTLIYLLKICLFKRLKIIVLIKIYNIMHCVKFVHVKFDFTVLLMSKIKIATVRTV